MKYSLWFYGIYCILLLLFAVFYADAQFEDAPDALTVDVGVSGDTHSRSGSLMVVYPLAKINGYVGLFGMHAYAEDKVQSEIAKARLQGGYDFGKVSLEGFIDTERNRLQGTDRETNIGYFSRLLEIQRPHSRISGGIGNTFENTAVRQDLGLKVTDTLNVPRWLAFASVEIHGITTLITYSPEISFGNHELEIAPRYTVIVNDNISIALNYTLDYDSEPVHDDIHHWHSNYSAVIRLHF